MSAGWREDEMDELALHELALFAGTGGTLLGWRTVCAVEKEPYCREVLLRRQRDGVLPVFPIWDDVRTFDGRPWRGLVDVVSAGFPCQPFSLAGARRCEDDERNMWPETLRVIREVGPRFAFLENVPGLLRTDYFGQILGDLAELWMDVRWTIVSAAECGAPHIRKRLWIVADAEGVGLETERRESGFPRPGIRGADVPDSDSRRLQAERERGLLDGERPTLGDDADGCGWWESEPDVGRVAHRIPNRTHRLKAIGNGQVPIVAATAWRRLARRVT